MIDSAAPPPLVLMVDDDEEDVYLTRRAFADGGRGELFRAVPDGERLFAYLENRGEYADRRANPRPRLILMDINMPRENGFELLVRLRRDTADPPIPVIMMSTSSARDDVERAYRLGANAFVDKPVSADAMRRLARHVGSFWLETALLP